MTINKKFLTKCETKKDADIAIAIFQRKFDRACIHSPVYGKEGQVRYYSVYELLAEDKDDKNKSR
jgi:hypothetical protein